MVDLPTTEIIEPNKIINEDDAICTREIQG